MSVQACVRIHLIAHRTTRIRPIPTPPPMVHNAWTKGTGTVTIERYEERMKREKQAELAAQYRAIGSAAILAALAVKMREPDDKIVRDAKTKAA